MSAADTARACVTAKRRRGRVRAPRRPAGQAFAGQEADELDVIVGSRPIYVLNDAARTCRDAASARGLNGQIQLDVLALHETGEHHRIIALR
jgi:hypothetical protein